MKKLVCTAAALGAFAVFATGIYGNRAVDVTPEAIRCAETGTSVFDAGFADAAAWEKPSFNSACETLAFGADLGNALAIQVTTNLPKKTHWDTYWRMRSKPIAFPAGARRFLLTFDVRADFLPILSCGGYESKSWRNAIFWKDASGREIGETILKYSASGADFSEIRLAGDIPAAAATGTLQFGFESPNIPLGKRLDYRNLRLSVLAAEPPRAPRGTFASEVRRGGAVSWMADTPKGTQVRFQIAVGDTPEAAWAAPFAGPDGTDRTSFAKPFAAKGAYCRYRVELLSDGRATPSVRSVTVGGRTDADWSLLCDVQPPVVRLASPSPFQDPRQPVAFRIADETFVKGASVRVTVDGRDRTGELSRKGNTIELAAPAEGWTNGLHTATVTVEDFRGRAHTASKVFFRGEGPRARPVTLRADGVLLRDGQPIFPIGACHVRKIPENGENFDRAVSELADAGFNMLYSWWNMYTPGYRAILRKHGMKCFFGIRGATDFAIATGRHSDEIVAWYIADDTSDNTTPAQLQDRYDALKAIDQNHLTIHASGMDSTTDVSGFRPYADKSDLFAPESYPLQVLNPDSETNCVAAVVRDMRKFLEETALARDGRPHAAWPMIQYFDRKTLWNPPTPEEFRGMCQAAVVNGAKGLFVYAYADFRQNPERWRTVCDVASGLRELSPVLLDDTPAPAATVTVTKGPQLDAYANPTVTALVKRHGDEIYVLTVNARREPVTARIRLDGACVAGPAKVWRGTEDFPLAADGSWTVAYPPHGVSTFVLKAVSSQYGQALGPARVWDFTRGKPPAGGKLQELAFVSEEGLGCADAARTDARGGFLLNQYFTPAGAFLFEAEVTVGSWAADHHKEHAGRIWDDMAVNYGPRRRNVGFEASLVQHADGYWVPVAHFGLGTDTYSVSGKQIRLPKGTRTKYAVYYGANGRVFIEFGGLICECSIPASGPLAPSRGYRPVVGSRPTSNYANFDGFVRRVSFTPMKRDPFVFRAPGRVAFARGEKDATLTLVAENRSEGALADVKIALEQFGADGRVGSFGKSVGTLALGESATVALPVETRILPGWHEIRATLTGTDADGRAVRFETTVRYGIGPKYADTLRTVIWGVPAALPTKALLDLGFTHGYVYLGGPGDPGTPFDPKRSYDVFDQALVDGLAVARIANCSFPPPGCTNENEFIRYDCLHRPDRRKAPEVSNPILQERFRAIGARDAAYFADHPALQGVLPFSEKRDRSRPSFNVEAKIYRSETGRDIPGHCLVDGRTFRLKEAEKRFPDGIVPEDDEIYLYYKWWLGGGDGWPKFLSGFFDEYHKRTAHRPEFLSFWDPAVRWAPCWGSGGSADMLNQWCYAVPEPMNAAGPCEEILAMANGRPGQKASIMTQLICYRSKMAPTNEVPENLPAWAKRFPKLKFPTIPPDVLQEATWMMLSKPVQAIMYHGFATICDMKGDSYYGFTNPESTVRIRSLLKGLVAPLGATLWRLGRVVRPVGVLESFTTCAMGGPASWGWTAPSVTFFQRARLDPRVVYEETILRDGLDGVKVLYAPQCRFLTPTIVARLKEFQKRGGILVADGELVSAVKPDVTIPAVSFEAPPESDYTEDVDKLEQAKAANLKTRRATVRSKSYMQEIGLTVRKELAAKGYAPAADSSSPEIVVFSRQWKDTPYLFAINDRRTFGDYVGQWGRVMEKGLPFDGWVTRKDPGARVNAVYELSRGGRVAFTREGDAVRVPVRYETNDGRLFVFLPTAIAALDATAPARVAKGDAFTLTLRVLGADGRPVPALLPVEVRVRDAKGRELDGLGYACAEGGVATLTVQTNLDDAPGAYEIVCRDRASGLEKRLTVE